MKKIIVSLLLIMVCASLFATETIWMWNHNDADAGFFRYCTSFDARWRVVPEDHFSVKIDSGSNNNYEFYLQQSYDGIHWSDSAIGTHLEAKKEETGTYNNKKDRGLQVTMVASPFQSFVAPTNHFGKLEKSVYSFGVDLDVKYYFSSRFGLGVLGSGNIGWGKFSLVPFKYGRQRIFGGAYLTLSYRILNGDRFVLQTEAGIGSNFDQYMGGLVYLSPSIYAAVEGGVKVNDNLTISMRPSLSVSFAQWNVWDDYLSLVIKSISLATSYSF